MSIKIFKLQKEINDLKKELEDANNNGILSLPGSLERLKQKIERLESEKNFTIQISTLFIAFLVPILSLIIFYMQNNLLKSDFELRMRPYLTAPIIIQEKLPGLDNFKYKIYIKNSGITPALITNLHLKCNNKEVNFPEFGNATTTIVGAGEANSTEFLTENTDKFTCFFDIKYRSAVTPYLNGNYSTQYVYYYFPANDTTKKAGDHFLFSKALYFE